MKILFVIESLRSGGKERRLLELIKFLEQKKDIQISLILLEEEIHYKYVESLNVNIEIFKRHKLKKDPTVFYKILNHCRKFKPDIIHTWGIMPSIYSIPAKLFTGKKMVSSIINSGKYNLRKYSLEYFFFKITVLFSNHLLSNSKAGLMAYKIKSNKASVINNGVWMDRFNISEDLGELKKKYHIANYAVIMSASFSNTKNYTLFVDVAKNLASIRNDIVFIASGDGPGFKEIRDRIEKEKISNIILTGRTDKVEKLISISDIGLLFTYSEGISNSIIEYMAMEKPVITTDTEGGSKELVIHEKTGYIVENSISDISNLIQKLLDNPGLKERMGFEGKKRISEHFNMEIIGEKYFSLYKKLIDGNKLY